jgi:DNA helicase HerA-like ATPase
VLLSWGTGVVFRESSAIRPDAPAIAMPFGRVLSCRGSEARVGLPTAVSLDEQRATVGKFVAIRSGGSVLVGMIAEVTAETGAAGDIRAIARVDLMGEIVREGIGGARFRRGVRDYPAIGDEVEVIGREDLKLVYSSVGSRSITVGNLHQDSSISACVDVDGLLTKHFAVLGSTGVGKSSGVAVILGGLLRARPDVRVLLLDVHNEYSRSFGDAATVIGSDTLKLPFWLFNFEEMTDVIYCGKPAVPEEVEILAELIPIAKGTYLNYKSGAAERPTLARRGARDFGFTADTPSPYLIQDLLTLIDERMGKLENRSSRMIHHRLMMRIEAIKNDPRYAFMFENANVGGDTMGAVLNQLFRLESEARGITVLKLASLPGETIDAVVCIVARLAFEFGLWSDGGIPMLLVCEEAHRYASADHTVGFAPTRRALSRIAKEGRKYGVSLGLVTQRPAELDPTIISQCSTLFVMRMANDEDQALLRSATSDATANLLSFVPSLATGEVVGIGEGMPLPARFTFKMLPHDLLPSSESGARLPDLAHEMGRAEFIRKAIERWRRATTNQTHWTEGSARGEPEGPGPEADGQSALARGLGAVAGDRQSPGLRSKLLDPDRYTILKR